MKSFILEFKEFINKGNLLAIAIGFVMGAATAAVVTSLVENIIMPIVAIPFGEPDFNSLWNVEVNDSVIKIGTFVTALVTFVCIAFTVFLLLKAYNKATGGEASAPAGDVALLGGILEELKGIRSELSDEAPGTPSP